MTLVRFFLFFLVREVEFADEQIRARTKRKRAKETRLTNRKVYPVSWCACAEHFSRAAAAADGPTTKRLLSYYDSVTHRTASYDNRGVRVGRFPRKTDALPVAAKSRGSH